MSMDIMVFKRCSTPIRDIDLALGRAEVNLLEAVGSRVDEVAVCQSPENGMFGEASGLALLAIEVDGKELDNAISSTLVEADGGGSGGVTEGVKEKGPRREAAELQP